MFSNTVYNSRQCVVNHKFITFVAISQAEHTNSHIKTTETYNQSITSFHASWLIQNKRNRKKDKHRNKQETVKFSEHKPIEDIGYKTHLQYNKTQRWNIKLALYITVPKHKTNFSQTLSRVTTSISKEQFNAFITARTRFIEAAYCIT